LLQGGKAGLHRSLQAAVTGNGLTAAVENTRVRRAKLEEDLAALLLIIRSSSSRR
jgi:hypothetical protein